MKLLNRYLNGNVLVTLFDNGTKIQEWDDNEDPAPIYPNSMDIKITNYCDARCSWCHEESTIFGENGDLTKLLQILEGLPRGTELAIGGGNPLDHPSLNDFLIQCKYRGLIPNLTVNYIHLTYGDYIDQLNYLIDNKLIYGVGISIPDNFKYEIISKINKLDNVVYHVIAGVNNLSIMDKIKESPVKKVLILGYKTFGRGTVYLYTTGKSTLDKIDEWKDGIPKYIRKIHMSFDNLALLQLKVQDLLSEEEWNSMYMGNDGVFTMYIDAVKQQYAKSSTSERRNIDGDIKELFSKIVKES